MQTKPAAARADEVAMAAIRVDPQILEEHLAVEATVDASRADDATRLAVWFNSENAMFNCCGCILLLYTM